MLNLDTTTALLKLLTSATGTIHVDVAWVDRTTATDKDTPGATPTIISTATTTTICGSPASGDKRNVKFVSIRNAHASTANILTVSITNGTTEVELFKVSLAAQEWLTFNDAGVLFVYNSDGSVKAGVGSGRLLKSTLLTAGTSFTTQPGTTKIKVRMVAGGGGGGGCTSVAAAAAAAGGGGAGGYAEKEWVVTPNTAYAYTIGALGAGASGAVGGNGGNTTFVGPAALTVTAFGGTGGPVATAVTTLVAYPGGAGGVVSTNGDLNSGGEPGDPGVTLIVATPIVSSGNGGEGVFGSGGQGRTTVGNGNPGLGFGTGGSGAATGASAVRTGGNGTAGAIEIDEYS